MAFIASSFRAEMMCSSVGGRRSIPDCQVTGRPDSRACCLVELVWARCDQGKDGTMSGTMSAVMAERRRLINLAYRMLGSLADAEDAVQETYARWYALSAEQQEAIDSPGAWLTTVASRICLDLLGSARARRERYVGEWIPEPLPEPGEWASVPPGGSADPADRVTLDE